MGCCGWREQAQAASAAHPRRRRREPARQEAQRARRPASEARSSRCRGRAPTPCLHLHLVRHGQHAAARSGAEAERGSAAVLLQRRLGSGAPQLPHTALLPRRLGLTTRRMRRRARCDAGGAHCPDASSRAKQAWLSARAPAAGSRAAAREQSPRCIQRALHLAGRWAGTRPVCARWAEAHPPRRLELEPHAVSSISQESPRSAAQLPSAAAPPAFPGVGGETAAACARRRTAARLVLDQRLLPGLPLAEAACGRGAPPQRPPLALDACAAACRRRLGPAASAAAAASTVLTDAASEHQRAAAAAAWRAIVKLARTALQPGPPGFQLKQLRTDGRG
jgi:hypothetical protein